MFPGGNFDSDQDDSSVTTAVRETFEETGLLLVSPNKGKLPSDSELDTARDAIHSRKLMFRDFLNEHGLSIDERSLLPFTQWITPPVVSKYVVFTRYCSYAERSAELKSDIF